MAKRQIVIGGVVDENKFTTITTMKVNGQEISKENYDKLIKNQEECNVSSSDTTTTGVNTETDEKKRN